MQPDTTTETDLNTNDDCFRNERGTDTGETYRMIDNALIPRSGFQVIDIQNRLTWYEHRRTGLRRYRQ